MPPDAPPDEPALPPTSRVVDAAVPVASPLALGDGSFESFAASLGELTDAQLAAVYRERSDLVADLERRLGVNRPRAQLAGKQLAARLKVSDPERGCGHFDGVFYRAHRDGAGVHRESQIDPRWRPPGDSRG